MSSLSDEQRRRMEENRRKALEKRAAAASRTQITSGAPANSGSALRPSNFPAASTVIAPNGRGQGVFRPAAPAIGYGPNVNASKQMKMTTNAVVGPCVLVARDRFRVDVGYHPQLMAIFKSIDGHHYDLNTKKWSFPLSKHSELLSAVKSLEPAVLVGALPNFVLRVFRNSNSGALPRIPDADLSTIDPTLVSALMKFQTDGVRFGISRNGRCLISDDMGLGKSIQALGIAHYYYAEWPLLIVCPSSMRYAWRESIWKWLPSVSEGSIHVIETGKDDIGYAKVLVTTYDMLSKRSSDFMKCGVVIMDESHHLKNHKTQRTKAAIPVMENAKRLILLSGTPALSKPIELYTQICAINRNVFPMINDYGMRYCGGKKTAFGWDFNGSSNMEELQLMLEETIMIRRLKSDVLHQLPSKMRKIMVLDPNLVRTKNNKSLKSTAAAFNSGKNLKAMERRGKLLEYYSETANAKLEAVSAYINYLVEDKKKFICFAHHKSMMDGICQRLEEARTKYIRIDGSTPAEDRKLAVDLFQTCEDVPVAVLSITAANSGITLTAAKLVIFAELYWNPGILTQAEDRAHRIGQEDSVLVEYLIAKGTADDVLWQMVQEKLKVLNSAGLSKDNFADTDATALVQRDSKPNTMHNYFTSSQTSREEIERECSELESDQGLLDQLLDESFN